MPKTRNKIVAATAAGLAVLGVATAVAESALVRGGAGNQRFVPVGTLPVTQASETPTGGLAIGYAYTAARAADPSYRARPITAATDAESRSFAALRQHSADPMPAALESRLSANPIWTQKFAPNFGLARLLSSVGSVPEVWLVPGDDSLCLYVVSSSDDGASTCQASADVAAGRLSLTRGMVNGSASITGVAPDGVGHVIVRVGSAVVGQVPVNNNLYVVPDATGVTSVTYGV